MFGAIIALESQIRLVHQPQKDEALEWEHTTLLSLLSVEV
jgi:hypothetical protein